MTLWSGNEQFLCKLFQLTFGKIASDWFLKLPKGCVKSWEGLVEMFVARFVTNRLQPLRVGFLLAWKINDGEGLRVSAKRYYEVYNWIPSCNQKLAIVSFKNGLKDDCPLRQSLKKTLPKNMEKLMVRIEKYARAEENRKAKKTGTIKQEKRNGSPKCSRGNIGTDRPEPGLKAMQAVSIVFKIPIYRVLERIKNQPYFRALQKTLGEYMDRNVGKNFAYHDKNEHMTLGCRALKQHLEDLVKQGHLRDLIDEAKT
ncbi:uncharacterized protein LOC114295478 [Camellia sinensis]|uniref:uncharacterized protein LOC114295478 n=1 Tax=Camellia sinensis TaxID=4442 RepID=UPI0010357DCE|nr:uncharacterized protein LOC114295478 [Camellia sinensis]